MTSHRRITAGEIRELREQYLAAQLNLCALCSQPLESKDAVLDHDHGSGQLRCTIHRFCNTFLGKIENGIVRNRIDDLQLENILRNVQAYIKDTKPLLHPTHRTPEERKVRAKKRARARRARS